MAENLANLAPYQQRMQRVIDHINAHLDDALDLDTLADVACLSRFHWHRVYRSLTGETIHTTVRRLKLNRASQHLKNSRASLGGIAKRAGYSSETAFGRAFKAQFGHSPASFRASPDTELRPAALKLTGLAAGMQTEHLAVNIRTHPARRLAVMHHRGPYNSSTAFVKLLRAMQAQGLPFRPLIGLSYDDPAQVSPENLRSLAGVEIGPTAMPAPPLELLDLPMARYAVFSYRGPYERLGRAYDWIFGHWLPVANETPANLPAMDIYYNSPQNTAPEDLRTDICIPLEERT